MYKYRGYPVTLSRREPKHVLPNNDDASGLMVAEEEDVVVVIVPVVVVLLMVLLRLWEMFYKDYTLFFYKHALYKHA